MNDVIVNPEGELGGTKNDNLGFFSSLNWGAKGREGGKTIGKFW